MKYKFLSICFLLIFITSLSITLVFNKRMKDNYITSDLKLGLSQTTLITNFLAHSEETDIPLYKLAQFFSNKSEFRVTFLDESGTPLADSQDNSIILNNSNNIFIIEKKDVKYPYYQIIELNDNKNKILQIFSDTFEFNKSNIKLVLSKELTFLEDFKRNIFFSILLGVLISGIISIILSVIFINKTIEPILALTKLAKNISNGDFKSRVVINSHDELKNLGDTFNLMSDKIDSLLKTIEIKAQNLQSIIDSLQASIIVITSLGDILLVNKTAINEFKLDSSIKNIFNSETFKNFRNVINEAILENKQIDTKIFKEEKVYRVKINNIYDNESKLLIGIQDITAIEMSDKLRREFVSNASHELKTPITIISGFIETIKLGHIRDEKQLNYFIDIIEKETKRLALLTENLLKLSKAEKMLEEENKIRELSLKNTLEDICNSFKNIADKKNIEIKTTFNFSLVKTYISEQHFRTILGNLIDNSIKYSNENSKILIVGSILKNNLILSIEDEGIGIPKEEINSIFRRFYRVDKSRNRKIEGNGLGLAIVKNLLLNLNGKIEIDSDIGKGTKIILTIPLLQ